MPLPVPGRVAEALRKSTVQVISGSAHQRGNGSGVVLTGQRVVTNAHVVRGKPLTVESWEGRALAAHLIQIDRRRDLAILGVEGLEASSTVLGDSDRLKVGTPIVAVGNPLGFIGAVSSGVVHSIGPLRSMGGATWIYADVRLAPGSSGGPLADFEGQIVGINTMIIAGGLALAIPSRAVQRLLTRATSRANLGVVVRPVHVRSNVLGMMILELEPGGAAERASLLPGDILVGANDSRFVNFDDLETALDHLHGSVIRLDFYRAGQEKLRHVSVTLELSRVSSAA